MLESCLVLLALAASPAEESVYLPKNLYLVRAKTVEVGTRVLEGPPPQPKIPQGRFEITKIYLGPDWLKKYPTFVCDHNPPNFGSVARAMDRLHVRVRYEAGAEGLWWVSYDPAKEGSLRPVLMAPYVDALGIRPFPYQKLMLEGSRVHTTPQAAEASFQEGLAWAEAVEKVYRAETDQGRAALLRGCAAEYTPRGAWAISWLSLSGDEQLGKFFRELLADEKLPIASQAMLDQALRSVDAQHWEGSPEQAALYRRWGEAYAGQLLPLPLQVIDAQRTDNRQPPLFSRRGVQGM